MCLPRSRGTPGAPSLTRSLVRVATTSRRRVWLPAQPPSDRDSRFNRQVRCARHDVKWCGAAAAHRDDGGDAPLDMHEQLARHRKCFRELPATPFPSLDHDGGPPLHDDERHGRRGERHGRCCRRRRRHRNHPTITQTAALIRTTQPHGHTRPQRAERERERCARARARVRVPVQRACASTRARAAPFPPRRRRRRSTAATHTHTPRAPPPSGPRTSQATPFRPSARLPNPAPIQPPFASSRRQPPAPLGGEGTAQLLRSLASIAAEPWKQGALRFDRAVSC